MTPVASGLTPAIATFTTDFGLEDAYVAEMKGAFLSELAEEGIREAVQLVDVTHLIPRHAVRTASDMLRSLRDVYPPGAVHLVIVDPGVGTGRRPLAVRSVGQWFVGPDNGVFDAVLDEAELILEIDRGQRRKKAGASNVFEGRDLFAPVAARLIAGRDPAEIGRVLVDPVRLPASRLERKPRSLVGEILSVDRFGNLRTSIPAADLPREARVSAGAIRDLSIESNYAAVAKGRPLVVVSSNGCLEIAAREASASQICGLGVGDEVVVAW